MTDFNANPITQADLDPAEFNAADLAALGEGHIAYVRPIRSDEVKRLFPQAPELSPGLDLFAPALGQRGSDPPRRFAGCDRRQRHGQRPFRR